MNSRGFIQLHRKIQDQWFWNDPFLSHAMVDLLLRMNHETKDIAYKGNKTRVNRGEHITTYEDLGEAWDCGRSTVGRRLKKLEKSGEIELLPGTDATHIRMVKYDEYLSDDYSNTAQERNTGGTAEALNNNVNNENNLSTVADFQSAEIGLKRLEEDEELQKELMEELNISRFTLEEELYKYKHHSMATNKTLSDWIHGFRVWMKRAREYDEKDYHEKLRSLYEPC